MIGLITKSMNLFKRLKTPVRRSFHTSCYLCMEPGASKNVDSTKAGKKHQLVPECQMKVIKPIIKFDPSWKQPKVVIVGSGMAGLSAGERLLQHGISNFIILEALGRPGGRIHTCQMHHAKIDLGSNEIFGANLCNAAFSLAVTEKVDISRNIFPSPYYTLDGLVIYEIDKPQSIMKEAFAHAAALFLADKKVNQSVKNYIDPIVNKAADDLPEPHRTEHNFVMNGMMNEIQVLWGDNLANISADYYGSYVRIPSGKVVIKNGGKSLINPLIEKMKDKIRFNKPVQNIRWDHKSCVCTNRGSVLCCDGEEITCDFVICTVSLGVLKAQAKTFFSPAIPDEKLEAIENLGYGHINYIFMEYEKPFWGPGEGQMKIGWNPTTLQETNSWLRSVGSFKEVAPRILRVDVGGRDAVQTESCPSSALAEDLTNFLRKLTGDPSIPCPISIMRSKWSTDVYFMGAKSFLGLSSSVRDQCVLACPIPAACDPPPVVLFAGEATVPGFFSTLHGARLSGIREADRILKLSITYKGPPCVKLVCC